MPNVKNRDLDFVVCYKTDTFSVFAQDVFKSSVANLEHLLSCKGACSRIVGKLNTRFSQWIRFHFKMKL